MRELSTDGQRMIEALIKAPVAWQSPVELARSMGRDLEETTDLIADLDAGGWLSPWELGSDLVVTLSVLGASRLGVRLVESGRSESLRWANQGDPEPSAPRASGVFRDERAANLERLVDPLGSPEEIVERAEELVERQDQATGGPSRRGFEGWPAPTLLIGSGLTPWPGPGQGQQGSCPSCGSKKLGPAMYCLYCDRWGLDPSIPAVAKPRNRPALSAREVARRREAERQKRKAKRQARWVAHSNKPRQRPGLAAS